MRPVILLNFLILSTFFSYGQKSVAVFPNYVVYNGDTLNRLDSKGYKSGIWIMLETDSISTKVTTTNPDTTYTIPNRPFYRASAKGQFIKGKRQGKWIFGEDDFKKIFSEVIYKDDKLISPILFYTTDNKLWLKAEKINGKWTYFLWDKEKNAYKDTHQKYTFRVLFGMNGYDYEKIK